MKQLKLNIPARTENTIEIAAINQDFPGIILCLKNNEVVGVILRDTYDWYFSESIYSDSRTVTKPELYTLITLLIDNKTCDSFNVIVFGE